MQIQRSLHMVRVTNNLRYGRNEHCIKVSIFDLSLFNVQVL